MRNETKCKITIKSVNYFSLVILCVIMCVFSVCVSAMHDASRRLQDCLADMYEPDWFGKEEIDTLAEVRQEIKTSHPNCSLLCNSIRSLAK